MKYYIVIFGCQMNISDAERIAGVLESANYKKSQNINEADLVVIVACSVRQSAIDRVYGVAEKLNQNQKNILTGCLLESDKKKFGKIFDYILDIKNIKKLPKILTTNCYHILDDRLKCDNSSYLNITPEYKNKLLANVPIMTGCNNFCSYCVVPYTRGKEISRPAKKIVTEIKKLVNNGYKEIWLLGQNVNSYKDCSAESGQIVNFPKLLKMVDSIPGEFKLNFTSSHPKDFSDELIQVMSECKNLSMDLNLPVQSGDDEILKKMNRPYTISQYKNLVKKIRKALPNIRLSTDVIVGFPGETKKQFNNTVKLFKEIKYGVAFINKYSPRQGTAASKMKDNVPWQEKKRREKILIDIANAKNKK